MGIKQRVNFDAGVSSPKDLYEINDQTGILTSVPKSAYSITETINLSFTYNMGVVGSKKERDLIIADGERRPGWAR